MKQISTRIAEAWSHWYVRLGVGVSTVGLAFLFVMLISSSGPVSPYNFFSNEKFAQIEREGEVVKYNELFDRDQTLHTQSTRYGSLVLLLQCLDAVPGVIATGVVVAFIGFVMEKPRNIF